MKRILNELYPVTLGGQRLVNRFMTVCGSLTIAALIFYSPLNGCHLLGQPENARLNKTSLPPIDGFVTTLEDEVRDLPDGQIAWSTYWKTCWTAYPDADLYEIEVTTMEGASPKLRRQKGPCHRIEIAAGNNPKAQGLLGRKMLINLQVGQLAFRYRAVLDEDRFSAWSPVIMVREP